MSHLDHGPPPTAEWFVTFADMMTLLMAFFVLLVSLSGKGNEEKSRMLLESIRTQFGDDVSARELSLKKKDGETDLTPADPAFQIRMAPAPTDRRIGGAIPFASLDGSLNDKALAEIALAAKELRGKLQRVELRADATPGEQNLDPVASQEMALRRCQTVMKALAEAGVDPQRIRVSITAGEQAVTEIARKHEADVEILMLEEFADQSLNPAPSNVETAAAPGIASILDLNN